MQKNETLLQTVKKLCSRDKVIARAIAAWLTYTAITLFSAAADLSYTALTYAQETDFLSMLLGVLLWFAIYSVISYALIDFEADSWVLLASATVCGYKWLVDYEDGGKRFLFVLAIILGYSMIAMWAIRKNKPLIEKFQPDSRITTIVSVCFAAITCSILAVITVLRYKTFSAPNYDFGIFCNMFHYMKETGLPLVTSERNGLLSHFAVHISPIYYLLLPFYVIFPTPETLQIGQAVVVASGIIPTVLLCRHYKLSGKLTIVVSFIYALYPALSTGCFYDIHENCFLTAILLWVFYFFERERWIPMYIAAVGVLMVKEDAAIYLIIFALFMILSRRKYLHGSILGVGAMTYFMIALHILKNYGDGVMSNRFDNLILNPDDGLVGAIKTIFVNPGYMFTQLFTTASGDYGKLVYILMLFLPLGFILFCTKRASRWILLAPMLVNLLTYYQYQYNVDFQYQFGVSAFLVYLMIMNLNDMSLPTRETLISIGAIACCCLYIVSVVPKLSYYTDTWETNREQYEQMEEILDTIPEDAAISVSTFLLPHVADREYVYEISYHGSVDDVDYVIFDTRYKLSADVLRYKAEYISKGYEILEEHQGMILILKK